MLAAPHLTSYLHALVEDGSIPAYALSIRRGGRLLHQDARGVASRSGGRPMGEDAIVRIFSMSKLITATAWMMLREERTLPLDLPIGDHLPVFSDPTVLCVQPDGSAAFVKARKAITVRDLLLHTSGIGYDFTVDGTPLHPHYSGKALFHPDRSTAEMVERIASLPLAFDPGTAELYGHSYDVLGHLIEVISGQPLEEMLRERLFDPLGMDDTGFAVPAGGEARFTDLYTYAIDRQLLVADRAEASHCLRRASLQAGGTGLLSTAADCHRFHRMLLSDGVHGGRQVVSPEAIRDIRRHCLPRKRIAGDGVGSGLVTTPGEEGGRERPEIGPYYSRGASGTAVWVDPGLDLIAVFMTQLVPPWLLLRYYPYLGSEAIAPRHGVPQPGMMGFMDEIQRLIFQELGC